MISSIYAREVIDSRGNPTVEAEVMLSDGSTGSAISPSGASTGSKEALELRDGDQKYCKGLGVLNAVNNINTKISDLLIDEDPFDQISIDKMMIELDGTENKSNLGANAILAVSLAVADAASKSLGLPLYRYIGGVFANTLPIPLINVINGGKHADNGLDIQEFMIAPIKFDSFKDATIASINVIKNIKSILFDKGLSVNVGDEGGFAPNLQSNEDVLSILMKAIENAGYKAGHHFMLALDCAASEFFDCKSNRYSMEGKSLTSDEIIESYANLCNKYPIFSIEDPLSEYDHDGFKLMTQKLGSKIQIVGDDLFVTNPKILQDGINNKMANALLVKFNQIGTLTETVDAINIAKKYGYQNIISHRSGESEDTKISHLAVGAMAGQIKTGSICRTDRVAKYNELIRIEDELCYNAKYAGLDFDLK